MRKPGHLNEHMKSSSVMTPTQELIWVSFILTGGAVVIGFFPQFTTFWTLLALTVTATAIFDFFAGKWLPDLDIQRQIRHSIPVGVWSKVSLQISQSAGRRLHLILHDHHPIDFESKNMPRHIVLPAQRAANIPYQVRPGRRGNRRFNGIDVMAKSPFGLWNNKTFFPLTDDLKVFPNFREVSNFALLATDNRLSQLGIIRRQKRGEGNDFHQLREYHAGDSLRQIDWKATSRYQKLISKEYQDERDQQVVFLLDCGRRMRHEEEGKIHLDQALNSMLLLAYVATQQDDAVGFMAFGGPRRWYPPRKSGHVVKELLEQTYDLNSTTHATDYLVAAKELLSLQRRRALVIILTNTRDEDHEDLLSAIQLLSKQHLVILADLRESLLDETLEKPVRDFDTALNFQAVHEYLTHRSRHHEIIRYHGAITLDVLAPQLPVALVNQYLNIKATRKL